MSPQPSTTAGPEAPPSRTEPVTDAYRREVAELAGLLAVELATGLTTADAEQRVASWGANELAEPARRPQWLRLLDQFRNWLIGILLAAAVVAGIIGDVKDAIVITLVLFINATLGFLQERRAERSLEALRQMLVPTARIRRDGQVQVVPARTLVPGDVVLLEAGDRIPADGRLVVAESVEAAEATLTGESHPVAKTTAPTTAEGDEPVPVAERTGMLFMNTALTRGRAEMIVTATGMRTEVGGIAEALRTGQEPPSPLQVQMDSLGRRLALVSGIAVAAYALVALIRGEDLADLALRAVALAVAAIPEGLPAVLALTLALGVHRMARRGAIIKRLASVEALGSATVVCSDKTGTLTLNEMTTRALWTTGHRYEVTGEGYDAAGTVRPVGEGAAPADLREAVLPFALCNDARLAPDGQGIIGDPTEAALLVLAAKTGLDTETLRTRTPRTGEIPFDPAAKYMATFHPEAGGGVRVHVKGAVDVLLDRCSRILTDHGPAPLTAERRREVTGAVRYLGGQGLRVLGAATTVTDRPHPDEVRGLTLTAIAGIADPPRPQARDAVTLAQAAGVTVKMITGDHADTAAAIARELGITGDVVTGTDLARMSESNLAERIEDIGVFARVAPEHKVTIVRALSERGHIVAMTGDGVNDAAALRAAHIGVAMGITGTDVAKEAADMVLTDDDFSTIVRAVREGRSIYDNIVTFVRFQLSTNIGAILTLLATVLAGLPAPMSAIQLLWVNIIMDGPPAMALGIDPPRENVMHRPPRPPDERILNTRRLTVITRAGAVMATGTVAVFAAARHLTDTTTAATMAFTTFVLFQLCNALAARSEDEPVLGRHQLHNRTLWICLAAVLVLQVIAVQVPVAQGVFDTVALSAAQWAICLATASTVVVAEHLWRTARTWLTPSQPA
ncbi:cation-translocating P-type ATPase [Streptomyces sp. NBC_01340]|uniref:cation-translocating P-type ATPase n=1 Tax=unclassified Streptomyces TaxID=2593676 RepID=UPI002256AABC|nr:MULTISPECIES: cation-translocating P-type ATPase [unclassified Streptomyces]MCX4459746.1 cation-translocating P-type ATPase [Streptomyces sp. NBC_01719]MCX4499104.1 cation-translocating P-type ATPase [Streptomyces sp. NBC_01728]WSI43529.1 cation-translocating P-type ATPase [Streptomyces sp. NBC_01340]